ncbi:MAG: hypothetical protein HZA02_11120 [Nitrospinae bacterium]|nr:hypothetical protein [Nitrospinota bacterium]
MTIFGRTVSILIAGFLAVAISGCGEQKKQAEERGRNVTQPLKDAQKNLKDAEDKMREQEKVIEQAAEDAGKE